MPRDVGQQSAVRRALPRYGLRDLADNHPELWSGVSGAYARSTLDCVLHFATRAKTTNVRVMTRQAAEFLQCRQDTASKRVLRQHEPAEPEHRCAGTNLVVHLGQQDASSTRRGFYVPS